MYPATGPAHPAAGSGYPEPAASPTYAPAPSPSYVPSQGTSYGTAPTGQDGWPEGLRGSRNGRTTDLTGELFHPDPLFAQAQTAPAPPTARPQPARPQPARRPSEFTAPAGAGAAAPVGYPAAPVGYPAAPVGYPAAPVGYVTPAAESAAERTQVISGEVVLWTTVPDAPAAAEGPGTGTGTGTGYPPADSTPADGIPHLLLCPECRQPNAENRTYCHPCGALLRPEPEPPEATRWQRIRQEYLERPDVWHWDRRWGIVAVALPVCMAAGMSMGSAAAAAQRAVPLVKDRFLSQYAVAPDKVSASSATKGFEANLASDGVDNKAWAPKGTGQKAVGQYWTAQFNAPFRLTSLLIVNGASKTPGQFFETGRPTKITVTATTTDQGLVEKEITLGGQPGPQRFDLGIDNVMGVQVRIEAVHPGLKPNMPVAMAEIQFLSRQET
ncbi:NADase-type glycan-binding domain-containing protein [Streptomyces sp. 5.8]|uniref:NADase-type glycan-binding domain-containing protein n=1 Tax=Streptomyces sp. 5.8 TaxID=3406571 RepID=UPI003BB48AEF